MKRLFIVILLFISLPCLAQAEITELKQHGGSIEDLVPENWKVLSSAIGDLNKDGIDDLAFVIQSTNPAGIQHYEEWIGESTINSNPRVLAIYLRDNLTQRLSKKIQLNDFIILRDTLAMDEPFKGIDITKKGVLVIKFNYWYSIGSWWTYDYTYKFRYEKNAFNLIGFDKKEAHRGTGIQTDYSINFLTGKMRILNSNYAEDTPKSVQWKAFKLPKLKTLKSLGKSLKWKFMGVTI